MHLSLLSSTTAARQLVMPIFSQPSTIGATGSVSILPVPTLRTEAVPARPFTLGHGPVVSSTTSVPDHQWTTGHEPVVVPTAVATLATVIKRSSTGLAAPTPNGNKSKNTLKATTGYTELDPRLHELIFTDCHQDRGNYIYFTLMSPDGSLALNSSGNRVLYYIWTRWFLSYPKTIRKALFNDPEPLPGCPHGHCISKMIPGTDLRLEYVENPNVFRAGWNEGHCGYMDGTQTISQNLVGRGVFGYLYTGAMLQTSVVAFMEQQLLDTFPTLEIGLILGFSVVLFPVLPLLLLLCIITCRSVTKTLQRANKYGTQISAAMWDSIRAVSVKASTGVERCGTKIRNAFWKRTDRQGKCQDSGQGDQVSDDVSPYHHYQLADVAAPPPAYSHVQS